MSQFSIHPGKFFDRLSQIAIMVLNLPSKPKTDIGRTDIDYYEGEHSPLAERGDITAVPPKQLPSAIVNKLSAVLTPEHLPGPAKLIYRPILLIAVGIHAFFLFMPQGKEAKKPPEQKEKPITISQVATGKATTKVPTTKLPSAKITSPKPTLPKVNIPSPTAPTLPNPKPKAEDKPPEAAPPTPDRPLPDVKPNQDTTPAPPGGGAKAGDPFQDFVHHPSAQAGQYPVESAMKVVGNTIDAVVSVFKSTLSGKKFDFTEQSKDGEKAVYQVSKDGSTKFLTFLTDGSDVAYILADAPFAGSIGDITGGKVVELPAQMASAISEISAENATQDDFDDPNAYLDVSIDDAGFDVTEPKSGVYKTYTIPNKQPGEVIGTLDSSIRNVFKEVKEVGTYGGGPVYHLSNGKTTFYLNVISRKGKPSDSVAIMFTQSPI